MHELLDAMPVGLVAADRFGVVTHMNPAAERLAGPGIRTALAHRALRDLLASAAGDPQPRRQEVETSGPPAQILSIEARALPSRRGVVAVIRDLTELRQLEAVRRDFVANVSHELRTPIGAIAVLADALARSPGADDAQRLALRVRTEADRLTELVSDLLDLSRIEAVRPDASGPEVDLMAVISQSVDRIRHLSRQREVSIEVSARPEVEPVPGDETQLVSAVVNLIENAVKYSEPGDQVFVEVEADAEAARIIVRDEGIGIPSRELDRIFERFYRVDRARRREADGTSSDGASTGGGGTGLGLAIVRHVAANHGGAVAVQSREGEGSTFVLTLPKGVA